MLVPTFTNPQFKDGVPKPHRLYNTQVHNSVILFIIFRVYFLYMLDFSAKKHIIWGKVSILLHEDCAFSTFLCRSCTVSWCTWDSPPCVGCSSSTGVSFSSCHPNTNPTTTTSDTCNWKKYTYSLSYRSVECGYRTVTIRVHYYGAFAKMNASFFSFLPAQREKSCVTRLYFLP